MTSSINFAVPFNLFKLLVFLVPMQRTLYLDFAFFNPCRPICGQQFMLCEHIIHVILGCNPSYVHFTVNCECAVI